MDLATIGTAILAGGIFGSILTVTGAVSSVFITNKLATDRERNSWVLSERHKASIEILDILSLKVKQDGFDDWTYRLRNSSLKFQLLYKSGDAPYPLRKTLEDVFLLIQAKKDGNQSEDFPDELKSYTKKLRHEFAESLFV